MKRMSSRAWTAMERTLRPAVIWKGSQKTTCTVYKQDEFVISNIHICTLKKWGNVCQLIKVASEFL